MCPVTYYQLMREVKDKKQQRYQMVMYAKEHGIKPAARAYDTVPKTVRKWAHRFKASGYGALGDLSSRPKHSPKALSQEESNLILSGNSWKYLFAIDL